MSKIIIIVCWFLKSLYCAEISLSAVDMKTDKQLVSFIFREELCSSHLVRSKENIIKILFIYIVQISTGRVFRCAFQQSINRVAIKLLKKC